MELTDQQLSIIEGPLDSTIFLDGPAGSGKTTVGEWRLSYLMDAGIPGRTILLLFPQRNLGSRYQSTISKFSSRGLSLPVSATYGGLARRMLSLFWPTILQGFPKFQPDLPPTFLPLETSLYFLSKIVEPLIENEGYFSSVVIQRNRLYSQILDNLNKAAVNSFPHTEIADRLISSWIGDPVHENIFHQAQISANKFRDYCYQHNLLDFSLQVEVFTKSLEVIPLLGNFIFDQYDHLIYDNCEEDVPVAHDFALILSNHLKSYLIINDQDAGYRSFLGASPKSALRLSNACDEHISFESIYSSSDSLQLLNLGLREELLHKPSSSQHKSQSHKSCFSINYQQSYPELADWIALKVRSLIDSYGSPGEIVILAPYLSDSLRFLLTQSLDKLSIPSISHRPSRALRDEPVMQSLLTLAALSHPTWEIYPSAYEIALALVQVIGDLDLTRGYLLSLQAIKNKHTTMVRLSNFDDIPHNFQERISFYTGNLYQGLLNWMNSYAAEPALPLDHFFTHLFGELLSLPGYGFHNDLTNGRVAAQIIDSAYKFRQSAGNVLDLDNLQAGKDYYRMVKTGVLANQYLKSWTDLPDDKVLISPAYTFLLNNKAVDYQFWLDIGSRGWYERIYQPLTNPFVLHRYWPVGEPWTDDEEQKRNTVSLNSLTTGLIRRCRRSIIGCLTDTDERGYEQKGALLLALNKLLLESPQLISESENAFNA